MDLKGVEEAGGELVDRQVAHPRIPHQGRFWLQTSGLRQFLLCLEASSGGNTTPRVPSGGSQVVCHGEPESRHEGECEVMYNR